MSSPGSTPFKAGKRHPFLLQQRVQEMTFWPCILLLLLCGGLLAWNPPELRTSRGSLSIILLGTAGILTLTSLFRLRAFARCRPDGLLLQFPLKSFLIPYAEILQTRPTELVRMFPPHQWPFAQGHFLAPISQATMVVIEMERLPLSTFQMRLWVSRYMICPDATGLALPVRDWLPFRAELDELRLRRPQAKHST
jgi:hypothetical protein